MWFLVDAARDRGLAGPAARLDPPPDRPGEGGTVPLDFTAIDFETANASNASACSVGLTRVRDGEVVATAGWHIQPPPGHDRFFEVNTRIHGLTADDCRDAKGWTDQLADLVAFCGTDVLVAHNAGFDMAVIRRTCEVTGDDVPPYRYFCTLQLARAAYVLESYRLPSVAAAAGWLDFPHHDATADAEACARIVIDAARRTGSIDVFALAVEFRLRVPELAPRRFAPPAPALFDTVFA